MALGTGQSQRFDYTGSIQNITLKPGQYKIRCAGARGGGSGEYGEYIEGIYNITSSTSLQICCGETPSGQSGGYGYGGGSSGESDGGKSAYGGGGGEPNNCSIDSNCICCWR